MKEQDICLLNPSPHQVGLKPCLARTRRGYWRSLLNPSPHQVGLKPINDTFSLPCSHTFKPISALGRIETEWIWIDIQIHFYLLNPSPHQVGLKPEELLYSDYVLNNLLNPSPHQVGLKPIICNQLGSAVSILLNPSPHQVGLKPSSSAGVSICIYTFKPISALGRIETTN